MYCVNRFVKVFLIVAILSTLLVAQTQLTPEMIMKIRYITKPLVSPNGKYVAFLKMIPAKENEGKKSRNYQLSLIDLTGNSYKIKTKYTSEGGASPDYQWSEDSEYLFYTAKYDKMHKKKQVYKISIEDTIPQQLTNYENDIRKFWVNNDQSKIFFISKAIKSEEEIALEKNGHDWKINEKSYNYNCLFLFDTTKQTVNKISPDSMHVHDFVVEPNEQNIIYQASEQTSTDYSYMFRDIYRISSEGKNNQKIFEHDGKLGQMQISPDGKKLAFLGGIDISDPDDGSLIMGDIETGKWKNISKDFIGSVTGFEWRDSQNIIFNAVTFNTTSLFNISLDGKQSKLKFKDSPVIRSIDMAESGKYLVLTGHEESHPDELYLVNLSNNSIDKITDTNPELNAIDYFNYEDFTWTARDGQSISGLILKPKEFQTDQSAPLYVHIHGGPESAFLNGWNNSYSRWPQIMAQKGCVVFLPNYRGSTGRGVEFSKANHGDMMGVDFNDVLDGIDALIEKNWVNPKKVGIAGSSYGGYMTAWAATKFSDRFAVGVMSAGISNQISKIGTTDTPHENALVHWNAYPWDSNFDLAWDRSPLKHFKNHHTPLLISHGEKDARVPVGQAYELYRALDHIQQAPVKLMIYPDEGHGLRKRAHRYHFMMNALAWFEKYLLN